MIPQKNPRQPRANVPAVPEKWVNPEPAAEARAQQRLVRNPAAQRQLRKRARQRAIIGILLVAALIGLVARLPASSRSLLLTSLFANRLLVVFLTAFGLIAISLLWSRGQRLDVWLFQALNLRGYHAVWMDRAMWVATFLGNEGFVTALAVAFYVLGDHSFAIALALGALSLWLFVTVIKALTDRARPFNLLRETRVIGLREHGLSFPSGHTAQTFFIATLAIAHFQLSFGIAAVLYGIAVLVGFTRVYLGVHYPRDVMAGAILAVIWGALGALVAPNLYL